MPKRLKVHANERIDIPDFVRASVDYSADKSAFDAQKRLLGKRSKYLEGFYVKLSDQTTSPGEVTVYNGNALNRDGDHLNNEDQINDSRTITLVGSSSFFYLEIEFTEADSDQDARAFWDPTYSNTSPDPDGREFNITVATRQTPDWQLVTPVSTTGFTLTTDPTAIRIPVMVLHTNSSNEILATDASNAGMFTHGLQKPSATLAEDISSGATSIQVFNSRLFGDSGELRIDGSETVLYTANNRDTNVFTCAPTISGYSAGVRIVDNGVTAYFVPSKFSRQGADPDPSVSEDFREKLWEGDEDRGFALLKDHEALEAGAGGTDPRGVVNVQTLNDKIDYLSAIIREMKYGSDTSQIGGVFPTLTTDDGRYFDATPSMVGGRSHYVTIGNGTTTFGDFNGTTDAVFQSAIDACSSTKGTVIYVKAGTYTISSTLDLDSKTIKFVGEHAVVAPDINQQTPYTTGYPVTINLATGGSSDVFTGMDVTAAKTLHLENLNFVTTGAGQYFLSILGSSSFTPTIFMKNVQFDDSSNNYTAMLHITGTDPVVAGYRVDFSECIFITDRVVWSPSGAGDNDGFVGGFIKDCSFINDHATRPTFDQVYPVDLVCEFCYFENPTVATVLKSSTGNNIGSNVQILNCYLSGESLLWGNDAFVAPVSEYLTVDGLLVVPTEDHGLVEAYLTATPSQTLRFANITYLIDVFGTGQIFELPACPVDTFVLFENIRVGCQTSATYTFVNGSGSALGTYKFVDCYLTNFLLMFDSANSPVVVEDCTYITSISTRVMNITSSDGGFVSNSIFETEYAAAAAVTNPEMFYLDAPGLSSWQFVDSEFSCQNTSTTEGNAVGIHVTAYGALVVRGCSFKYKVGNESTAEGSAIKLAGGTAASHAAIVDNQFSSMFVDGFGSAPHTLTAIKLDDAYNVHISGNTFINLNASTLGANGIAAFILGGAERCVISNNHMMRFTGPESGGSGTGAPIYVPDPAALNLGVPKKWIISNNVIEQASGYYSTALMLFVDQDYEDINISGNILSSLNATGAGSGYGVYFRHTFSTSQNRLAINNNQIECTYTTASAGAILLYRTLGTDSQQDIEISNNDISWAHEQTLLCAGIYLKSDATNPNFYNVIIVGNNVKSLNNATTATAGSAGILVEKAQDVVINSNHVSGWYSSGEYGIAFDNVAMFICATNLVSPSNTALDEIYYTAPCSKGLISDNVVCDNTSAGTVTAAGGSVTVQGNKLS